MGGCRGAMAWRMALLGHTMARGGQKSLETHKGGSSGHPLTKNGARRGHRSGITVCEPSAAGRALIPGSRTGRPLARRGGGVPGEFEALGPRHGAGAAPLWLAHLP